MVHRRRCRHRYRYGYRRYRVPSGFVASAVAVGIGLAALGGYHHPSAKAPASASSTPGRPAAAAIAYARAQLGKPYLWGGTGPDAFDCSGLVMEAYASAGIRIARTSQAQWATERRVSSPQPGDLVFYPGADGTWTSPGHVALVIGGGQMIEAYGTGYPVREVPVRPGMAGFTQPWGA
jgi:cell wall-associated NlpC family hydrolase